MINSAALALAAALLSAISVGLVRRYAMRSGVMDIPNARSSHTEPTPRGGGLAVIAVFCAMGAYVMAEQHAMWPWVVLPSAAAVALVGWVDDQNGLSVRARLLVHLSAGAALAALSYGTGGSMIASVWWLFWAVCAINVVNFMDGIETLVASQCVIFAATIAAASPAGGVVRPLAVTLAGACAGFLLWNWPPARIFLGDVGSGALGLLVAALGLLAMRETDRNVVRTYLPLFPLFMDAGWTLVRRLSNGEKVTQPHRSQIYQRLANGGWGAATVSAIYAAAAIVGSALALVPDDSLWWRLVTGYGLAVLILGWWLDRQRPFVPSGGAAVEERATTSL
ncbi:MAG: lipopolysaccharide biosynthesis protein [Gemmatimonadaceae bacterium]